MDDREEKARLRRLQDYADLLDETAGRSTGKIRRFTPESDTPEALEERRRANDTYIHILTLRLADALSTKASY
jgi:hypothetical protein